MHASYMAESPRGSARAARLREAVAVPGVPENPMDEASLKAESSAGAMKKGRGCECVMHKLASLQPIHAPKRHCCGRCIES
jgi:hypothetical protein